MCRIRILLLILLVFNVVMSARILTVSTIPSLSHSAVFKTVILELIKRGHNVTAITTNSMLSKGEQLNNYTEINLGETSYALFKKLFRVTNHNNSIAEEFKIRTKWYDEIFYEQLKISDVLRLRNEKFELVIVELMSYPAVVFGQLINAPIIELSASGGMSLTFDTIGASTHHILFPLSIYKKRIHQLTFWEQIHETFTGQVISKKTWELDISRREELTRITGTMIPDLTELRNKIGMFILNVNVIWDLNRPVPLNTLYAGGLHLATHKALPEDLRTLLDSSKGAIYVSFGTTISLSMLPKEVIEIFKNVFSRLPYLVLWKVDQDVKLPRGVSNIVTSKWFPQVSLLYHSKVKLFITHGGLQSTEEAILAGVPLIGVPLFGDHYFNTEIYERLSIGKKLDINEITKDTLSNAIEDLTSNNRNNLMKIRSAWNTSWMSPLERAVYWIEYAIIHGGRHLKSTSANLSCYEYFEVQLLLELSLLAAFFTVSLSIAIRRILSKL